jgi:hypothetical protein
MRIGSSWTLEPAEVSDIAAMIADVRPEDVEEWDASVEGGLAQLPNAIQDSQKHGEVWCIKHFEGTADIMWGVAEFGGCPAVVWLLGTLRGQENAFWMLAECREFYEAFFKRWPDTICWSDERQEVHHRWLEHMGYQHILTQPYGPYGYPFRVYRRTALEAQ